RSPWIWLLDLRLEPCPLRQVVQGLPQRRGEHANEHVRLGAAAVVMPNRSQQQVALENAERSLDHGQLHVCLPEFRCRPTALVAPQQLDAIAGPGGSEFIDIPDPRELGPPAGADRDADEGRPFREPRLDPADSLQDLVAVLQPSRANQTLEFFQGT